MYGSTMGDKICRYILQLRRYGSERSHSRTNQRSRNERIGAGRGFGPRLSLNSGCSLIFFFFFFSFFSFSLFCFYMHVLVPKIYPTCIENLAVWVCIVMYLVHSYIRSRYIRSTSYFRLFSIRTMAILYIMYYIHVMVLIT